MISMRDTTAIAEKIIIIDYWDKAGLLYYLTAIISSTFVVVFVILLAETVVEALGLVLFVVVSVLLVVVYPEFVTVIGGTGAVLGVGFGVTGPAGVNTTVEVPEDVETLTS